MSWEHNRYRAVCRSCGHEGVCIQSSDDWCRHATRYEGFEEVRPSETEVGRKRTDSRDMKARCPVCGGGEIEQKEHLGSF